MKFAQRLTISAAYQHGCCQRANVEDKYSINPDNRLLATWLVQEHESLARDIRHRLADIAVEKQLDHTADEHEALIIFTEYVADEQFIDAGSFINASITGRRVLQESQHCVSPE